MNAELIAILAADTEIQLVLFHTNSVQDDEQWYAALRDEGADELSPERAYGYGATAEEAIADMLKDWNS